MESQSSRVYSRKQVKIVKALTGLLASGVIVFVGGDSPVSAAPRPEAKCSVINTPMTSIPGFRRTTKNCVRNTFSENKFVFLSSKEIEGTDLANEKYALVARLFQNLNRSLGKSWDWSDNIFDKKKRITASIIKSSKADCVDVYRGCEISASRIDPVKQRVSSARVTIEWIAGDCISPPYCGGWYSSMYQIQVTVVAREEFWE